MAEKHNQTAAIILGAGKGTRMKSDLPKVLHQVASKPMIAHVMDAASAAGCSPLVVVTAPGMRDVIEVAEQTSTDCRIAIQGEQLGTGHAVLSAKDSLKNHKGNVLVLFGDSPLMLPETFERMQRTLSKDAKLGVVILGFHGGDNPPPYGRLIQDGNGNVERIVEAKDASAEELQIPWVNSGVMAIRGTVVWDALEQIGNDNAQGEYYLTDIVETVRKMGYACAMEEGSETEVMGINTRQDLASAEAIVQARLRDAAMKNGVTMIDPSTTYLAADTSFGQDVVIQPNVFFGAEVAIGNGVEIRAFSHIEGAVIGDRAMIGPYARIRPGSNIGETCRVGNFVELKKAHLEEGAKVSHLSYIGDAHVGQSANVGAGTITCNYDGYNKYHTEIGAESFIGSNSALVAPVVIGKGAIIGAGSVVTQDVHNDALALSRSRQSEKENWAQEFRDKMKKEG